MEFTITIRDISTGLEPNRAGAEVQPPVKGNLQDFKDTIRGPLMIEEALQVTVPRHDEEGTAVIVSRDEGYPISLIDVAQRIGTAVDPAGIHTLHYNIPNNNP